MTKGILVKGKVLPGVISSCSVKGSHPRASKEKKDNERELKINLEIVEALDLRKLSRFFTGKNDVGAREKTLKIGISLLKLLMSAQSQGMSLGIIRSGNIYREIGYVKGSIFNEGK
jgi:hypothetical protein